MSIVSAIYKTPIVATMTYENGKILVLLQYENKIYEGRAKIAPEDKDFFSERVGINIAKSRARLSMFHDAIVKAKRTAEVKNQMKKELINTSNYCWSDLDPTGCIQKSIEKSEEKINILKRAYKNEKNKLNNYLKGQTKMIESVKRHRNKAEDN